MTCQCPRSSAISVVIWFLAISSFTRSHHLSFGLLRFRFPSTVICNVFLVAPSSSRLCTCPTSSTTSLWGIPPSGTCVPFSRCLHFSHYLVSSFLLPTSACAFQLCEGFTMNIWMYVCWLLQGLVLFTTKSYHAAEKVLRDAVNSDPMCSKSWWLLLALSLSFISVSMISIFLFKNYIWKCLLDTISQKNKINGDVNP